MALGVVSVVVLDVVHVVVKVRDIKSNSTYLYDLHSSWRLLLASLFSPLSSYRQASDDLLPVSTILNVFFPLCSYRQASDDLLPVSAAQGLFCL